MDLGFLETVKGAHLLVAGEVGIDEYIWGDTRRISPEAPVPVVEVSSQSERLGLAANVAQNIVSLGGKASLVTVRGRDKDGERLDRMIREAGISDPVYVEDDSRPTLRKVRIICQKQHVVRVDYERVHGLDVALAKSFTEKICDLVPGVDGVIVQDYGKGLWNPDTMSFVKQAKAHGKPVFVDPNKHTPLGTYRGCTLLTPNYAEAETLCGLHDHGEVSDERLNRMGSTILGATEADTVIITCGPKGMVAQGKDGFLKIPTFAREVFDVTGAGDTVIAVLSLMRVLGYSLEDAMHVANAAAGVVVGQIGTATCSQEELVEALALAANT